MLRSCVLAFGLFVLAAIYLGSSAFAAKLYKWKDAEGKVHYTDQLPEGAVEVEEQSLRDTAPAASPDVGSAATMAEAARKHPVAVYLVSNCESCDLITLFLEKYSVPFVEYDVRNSEEARQALLQITPDLILPLVTIGDATVTGYRLDVLKSTLTSKGYPLVQEPASGS